MYVYVVCTSCVCYCIYVNVLVNIYANLHVNNCVFIKRYAIAVCCIYVYGFGVI